MKEGQKVNFYRPDTGKRVDAEVVEITGAGANQNKILTLKYREEGKEYIEEGVYHLDDAAEDAPFWLLKGTSAPKNWAE